VNQYGRMDDDEPSDAAPRPAAASTGLSLAGGAVAPNTQHGPATIAAGRSCRANSYCLLPYSVGDLQLAVQLY
jgi:hypothetical protein